MSSLLRPHSHSLSSLCRPPDWVEYESSPQVTMFLQLNIQSPVLVLLLFSETSPTTGFTGWDHCSGAQWPPSCTRQAEEHPCLPDHSSSPHVIPVWFPRLCSRLPSPRRGRVITAPQRLAACQARLMRNLPPNRRTTTRPGQHHAPNQVMALVPGQDQLVRPVHLLPTTTMCWPRRYELHPAI